MQTDKALLIVDDEELNRAILNEIFYKNYIIYEAENGKQALDILEESGEKIVMVLLDVIMPVLDGFGVLEEMRRRKLLNKIPVVLITAESSDDAAIRGYEMGVSDIINKPFNPDIVRRRVENVVQLYLHKLHLEELVSRQLSELELQAQKIKQTSMFIIDTLSTAVEFRSCESGQHIKRMRFSTRLLLEEIARAHPEYGLTDEQIETVANVSVLHDIGKIAIPDAVLNKPAKLTDEEFVIMKTHAEKGCEIIQTLDYIQDKEFLNICYDICRHHHERWDGRGYPDGLKGTQISLWSQAVGLADVYDALTSERVYKHAYTHGTAVKMIVRGECGIFSSDLLQCFLRVQDNLQNC